MSFYARKTKQPEAPHYRIRATRDELKRGQTSEQVDSYYRHTCPGYSYWAEAHGREQAWEAECQKRLKDFKAEFPDGDMTTLQRKRLSELQQDLTSATERKVYALEQMERA